MPYSGYSFAVPSNIVSKVVGDLLDYGLVQRAYIGVSIRDVNAQLKEQAELNVTEGVYLIRLRTAGYLETKKLMIKK